MSADRNVAALHDAGAQWNSGHLEGYLALYDPEAILQGYAGVEPGLPSIRRFYQAFWAAFPGSRLTFEDVFASGEKVPPTGVQITMPGITILEFRDGKCTRRWSYADSVGLLQQLGALPSR